MSDTTDRAIELSGIDIDEVVSSYLASLLWSVHDELFPSADNDIPQDIEGVDRSEHGEMLDAFYGIDNISEEYVAEVRADIVGFVAAHPLAVRLYLRTRDDSDFGHDLVMSRDNHGTGFWDRGLGELGRYLDRLAEELSPTEMLTDGALCSDPNGVRVFESGTLY